MKTSLALSVLTSLVSRVMILDDQSNVVFFGTVYQL